MNQEKAKILEKLAGIMNLAKDQEGTHEGKTALKLASKLMAKHRIAESEIDLEQDAFVEDEVEAESDKGGYRPWVTQLASCLAYCFDCKSHFRHSKYNKTFKLIFVGTESDVETCTYFQEIVMHHIEKGAWKMWSSERNWRKRNAFGDAAMSIVSSRLLKIKESMKVQEKEMGSSCTDIVVVKMDEVAKTYKEAYPNIKTARVKKSNSNIDRKTWLAGLKAGETAPLNTAITADDAKQLA